MRKIWSEGLRMDKPRWMVLLIDMLIMSLAFVFSYILIFNKRGGVQLDNLWTAHYCR